MVFVNLDKARSRAGSKFDVTFSDAITAVRRYLRVEGVFSISGHREAFEKRGDPLRQILRQRLAPTA